MGPGLEDRDMAATMFLRVDDFRMGVGTLSSSSPRIDFLGLVGRFGVVGAPLPLGRAGHGTA